ncbi:MAG TPA: hypothetical protein VKB77_10185 [Terriglobales bacterium]|nr:hypothetical protein [Terriglobales bacterium]
MKRAPRHRDLDLSLVALLATCTSLVAFLWFLQHDMVLLYGDAVARINIARRVFDSRTPGPLQLGTVWLPLPHLLIMPFIVSLHSWQTGAGGSVPSMAAYVLGVVGILRLVRSATSFNLPPDSNSRVAAWIAAAVYAANPNLLYLQSTALTEALYLALFIWTLVYFTEFVLQTAFPAPQGESRAAASLTKCAWCLAAACLTRYDGWFLSAVVLLGVLVIFLGGSLREKSLRPTLEKFVLISASAPVLWLAYNSIIYRNPLEFLNGPYSAHAIEQKSPAAGVHPGTKNLPVAVTYFLKSAEQNVGEGFWQKIWLLLALAGTVLILADRRLWPLLLLWTPLPFYALAVAYGGVPVYVPGWWPFSYYNVRYGIQLLPAFAAFLSLVVYFAGRFIRNTLGKTVTLVLLLLMVAGSYAILWRIQPVCVREARINSRTRIALETQLAETLSELPHDTTILMYLGDHVGALQRAAIPLKRTINEGDHRPWIRPSDPEGLWERALADPAKYADLVVAFEGDPVSAAVDRKKLFTLEVLHTYGQAPATIYMARRPSR